MYLIKLKLEQGETWPTVLTDSFLGIQSESETTPLAQSEGPYAVIPLPDLNASTSPLNTSTSPSSTLRITTSTDVAISPIEPKKNKTAKNITMGKSGKSAPFKIVVIGDQVGKSQLILRFIYDTFQEFHDETVEDRYNFVWNLNGIPIDIELLDTSGSDIYIDNNFQSWYTGADGFILVYSIDNMASFKTLETHRLRLMKIVKDDRIPCVVAATKLDRDDTRAVGQTQGLRWAQLYRFGFVECSAKTGQGVTEVFEQIVNKLNKNLQKGIQLTAHRWKKKKFSGSKNCNHCKKSIWGLLHKEGFECEICQWRVHKHCKEKNPANCPGSPNQNTQTNSATTNQTGSVGIVEQLPTSGTEWKSFISEASESGLLSALQDTDLFNELQKHFEKKKEPKALLKAWSMIEKYRETPTAEKGEQARTVFDYLAQNQSILKLPVPIFQELKSNLARTAYVGNEFSEAENFVYKQLQLKWYPQYLKESVQMTLKTMPNEFKEALASLDQLLKDEAEKSSLKPSNNNNNNTVEYLQAMPNPSDKLPLSNSLQTEAPKQNKPSSSSASPYGSIPKKPTEETNPPAPPDTTYDSWFVGAVPRPQAEEMLFQTGKNSFLLRTSSQKGCYALSKYSCTVDAFIHFLVEPIPSGGYRIADCPNDPATYPSLSLLIASSPVLKGFFPIGG